MSDFGGIDWNEVPESSQFSPIPAGEYKACLCGTTRKKTKSGDGEYLELCWQIIDGVHRGRMLWSRHNLWNKSQAAVDIAKREIRQMLESVSMLGKAQNASDILNLPLIIKVKLEKRKDTGEDSNAISAWKSVQSAAEGSFVAPTQRDSGRPAWAQ